MSLHVPDTDGNEHELTVGQMASAGIISIDGSPASITRDQDAVTVHWPQEGTTDPPPWAICLVACSAPIAGADSVVRCRMSEQTGAQCPRTVATTGGRRRMETPLTERLAVHAEQLENMRSGRTV